ncbi:MurT ligase domain-containing protein [Rhabdothermincola salaria]|uniref:MurT ligase domain-containing protein n=1 Tax=Rhabdothermincola salaria TaxID=2903142 RepID=UPI001E3EEF0F|nr:MurT ligase domain-containing protein [Rhabdothermincola salaria]
MTPPDSSPADHDLLSPRPWRTRLAVAVSRAVAGASRAVHFGSGSVIGGRAALAVDPALLANLTARRPVALVSATNGKTTTTRLLSAALGVDRPVVSNALGANMTPGIVAALGPADPRATAVLEVDERWLEQVLADTGAATVVLLNLSRDQLDRTQEVRKLAERWRRALTATPPRRVVANADDPLVTWAAMAAPAVVWVGTGQDWTADAAGCPACSGRIAFEPGSWHCTDCALARPEPEVTVALADGPDRDEGQEPAGGSGRATAMVTLPAGTVPVPLALPGRVNRVNAAFALAAATAMGADAHRAASGLAAVTEIAGRYRVADVGGTSVRLVLAKNPAGWHEALDLLAPAPAPVVVAINARIADGHDPSWLWDVPFERLAGRFVVATGERRHDLAVRLRYADVDHRVATDLDGAVAAVRAHTAAPLEGVLDVAANYTAFQEFLEQVGGPR